MKLILLPALILLSLESFAQNVPKLRINPTQAYGGNLTDLFSSIEYIPLETTKESLFGFIQDIIITDSSIVITDFDTKSLLFFSPEGKFLTKIKGNKNSVPEAAFDKETNTIKIIKDFQSRYPEKAYYISCSLTGKQVSSGFLLQKK